MTRCPGNKKTVYDQLHQAARHGVAFALALAIPILALPASAQDPSPRRARAREGAPKLEAKTLDSSSPAAGAIAAGETQAYLLKLDAGMAHSNQCAAYFCFLSSLTAFSMAQATT